MAGITKGPWKAEHSLTLSGGDFWSVYGADGKAISYMTLDPDGALAANVRAMTAAPEMISILERLEVYAQVQIRKYPYADDAPLWQDLLGVLAKARGE